VTFTDRLEFPENCENRPKNDYHRLAQPLFSELRQHLDVPHFETKVNPVWWSLK
jgi:hypothetical protein